MVVQLRPLCSSDARPLARLHRVAFPGFFLSSLGEPFLVELYRGFAADDSTVGIVAWDADGTVRGSIVGTTQPAGFFSRLVKRRGARFALASSRPVLRHPSTMLRLLRGVRYRAPAPAGASGAMLSSLCVDPRSQGAGIGRLLLTEWTDEVTRRGASSAFLTTDADSNNAVNGFYRAAGWIPSSCFVTREGRRMNCYTKKLDGR